MLWAGIVGYPTRPEARGSGGSRDTQGGESLTSLSRPFRRKSDNLLPKSGIVTAVLLGWGDCCTKAEVK